MGFFRTFLASLLAIFVSFLILFFFFIAMIAGLASQGASEAPPYVRDNTVLVIPLSGSLPEIAVDDPFEQLLNPGGGSGNSVANIRENLRKAASDTKIQGVWLKLNPLATSWVHLHEIRQALLEFSESGKFIYASTDDLGMNEQAYYLATASDSLFSPAQSFFEFDGFYLQPYFLKDLFDKIGIEAQVGRSGDYKTFAETYTRNDLSPENREQYAAILSGNTAEFMRSVSEFTGKSVASLDSLLNSRPILSPQTAHENGLIQALMYPDEVERHMKQRLGIDEDGRLNTVTNAKYARVTPSSVGIDEPSTDNRIAVIHASGEIMPNIASGFMDPNALITANNFKSSLDKVLDDDNVKALVVRIDSPGGAASTSDLIHHMLREASEKIPVVASMGPTAASGGYYIAMGADTVVASPFTVTGSIGVISMKYNVQELAEDKLGITFDEVRSHTHADWLSFTRPFSDKESDLFQDFNSQAYETFLSIVGENRGMSRDEVHAVAQGRVWLGSQALDNGLVDVLGGYGDALRIAGEMAGIDAWRVVKYPEQKTFIERLTQSTQNMAVRTFSPVSEVEKLAWRLLHLTGPGQGLPIVRMPVEFRIF